MTDLAYVPGSSNHPSVHATAAKATEHERKLLSIPLSIDSDIIRHR